MHQKKSGAGYGMFKYKSNKLEIIAGARVEHTNQGYNMLFATGRNKASWQPDIYRCIAKC
jgi:hypothetical protein